MHLTASQIEISDDELDTLRHMRGINDRRKAPLPYRDYFAAEPDDPRMAALAAKGLVKGLGEMPLNAGMAYWRCTPVGRAAALSSARELHARYIAQKATAPARPVDQDWPATVDAVARAAMLAHETRHE